MGKTLPTAIRKFLEQLLPPPRVELDLTADEQTALRALLNAASHTDTQPKLFSGQNIKTVSGQSILGSGDLVPGGSPTFSSPTCNTAAVGSNDQKIANTAFVQTAIGYANKVRIQDISITGVLDDAPFNASGSEIIFELSQEGPAVPISIDGGFTAANLKMRFDADSSSIVLILTVEGGTGVFDAPVAVGDAGVRNPEKVTTWTKAPDDANFVFTDVFVGETEKNFMFF